VYRLITAVLISLSVTTKADPYKGAVNKTLQAVYLYGHFDADIDVFVKHYEDKLTPGEKKYGGYVAILARIAIEKKAVFTWRFP
jgi:hypothetical protein